MSKTTSKPFQAMIRLNQFQLFLLHTYNFEYEMLNSRRNKFYTHKLHRLYICVLNHLNSVYFDHLKRTENEVLKKYITFFLKVSGV